MSVYADIEVIIGSGHDTNMRDGETGIPVSYAGASIADASVLAGVIADMTAVDDAIELITGDTVSLYKHVAEYTLLLVVTSGDDVSAHAFLFDDSAGFDAGLVLQSPAVGLRV